MPVRRTRHDPAIRASPGDLPADGRFEIGSVTKTMTATLLALLQADGVLELDDEVSRWLPASPDSGITLRQLATHTSGLPRIAPNHGEADPANPYARFGPRQAEEGLRLHMSAATAKTHVSRLLTKLVARDRTQLVVIAYETGLVHAPAD
jgi:CubicO group peptidase (beta-lactamase class C family)